MMRNFRFYVVCLVISISALSVQAQAQFEKDLESLRAWMKKTASQGDSVTRAEWPSIKENFKTKTTHLDKSSATMSQETKEEYSQLKQQYKAMEARHEDEYGKPLKREEAAKWEKELAGRTNLRSIRPSDLRDVFVYFLEGVRGQRAAWSLRDWEYAEHVYLELSTRKQVVLDKLSAGDKIKIAALQVEFNTLRKSRDVKDKYEQRQADR